MPTPFTHLAIAQKMLVEPKIPADCRNLLFAQRGAFYLGQIAADGHHLSNASREGTHFYNYSDPIVEHPWRVMMTRNPALWDRRTDEFRAFLAGYIAHLAVDEHWLIAMTRPHFADREDWSNRADRFLSLHLILIHMDERDYTAITRDAQGNAISDLAARLGETRPEGWLPFMTDAALSEWGGIVREQIEPGGRSETYQILAPRVKKKPSELRDMVENPVVMERRLWKYVPRPLLARVEAEMYTFACDQVVEYLSH